MVVVLLRRIDAAWLEARYAAAGHGRQARDGRRSPEVVKAAPVPPRGSIRASGVE
jgi:hypothetical protein